MKHFTNTLKVIAAFLMVSTLIFLFVTPRQKKEKFNWMDERLYRSQHTAFYGLRIEFSDSALAKEMVQSWICDKRDSTFPAYRERKITATGNNGDGTVNIEYCEGGERFALFNITVDSLLSFLRGNAIQSTKNK